jgi:crossover junction endonuclease MUS81
MEVTRTNSTGHPDFDIQSAIKFPPGSYEIILIMDCRELHKKRDVDEMTKGLLDKGVKVEVRALKMGDITWIARDTTGKQAGEEKEVVLDFVVERKRLDDLVGSIKDGRYDDQKVGLSAR